MESLSDHFINWVCTEGFQVQIIRCKIACETVATYLPYLFCQILCPRLILLNCAYLSLEMSPRCEMLVFWTAVRALSLFCALCDSLYFVHEYRLYHYSIVISLYPRLSGISAIIKCFLAPSKENL